MAKKTYKVTGPHPVDGHAPGDEFTADMGEEREQQLVEGGHIRVVPKQKNKKEEDR